jgi:hypothetical protein
MQGGADVAGASHRQLEGVDVEALLVRVGQQADEVVLLKVSDRGEQSMLCIHFSLSIFCCQTFPNQSSHDARDDVANVALCFMPRVNVMFTIGDFSLF